MPPGGSGKPDGASPFRSAAGVNLVRLKSSKNITGGGYFRIVDPRKNGKFWIKAKLDGVKGSGKSKLWGTPDGHAFASAKDAATALAEYEHEPYELRTQQRNNTENASLQELKKKMDAVAQQLGYEDRRFTVDEEELARPMPTGVRGLGPMVECLVEVAQGGGSEEPTLIFDASALGYVPGKA